jgi:hypothetical protein
MAEPKHLDDLDLRLGEDDNHRQLTMEHEAIALVRPRILRLPQDGVLREQLAQGRNQFPLCRHAAEFPDTLQQEAVVQRFAYTCAALLILQLSSAARAEEPSWVGIYVNDEQSDAGVQKAIEAAIADMNFITRSVARSRLKKTNTLAHRIAITRQAETITVRFDERKPAEMPADGRVVKWTGEDGEQFDVFARTEDGRLVQTFKAEDGQRVNAFTAEDAQRLTLEVQVTSPRLPKPLTYAVRYKRAVEK